MPLCPDFCSLGGDKTRKTKELSEKYPESAVLVLQGGFYHAEGKSAEALASMTGYKLRKTKTGEVECGFPFGSLDKIMKLFEEKRVNYLVYRKDEIIHEYSKGVVLNEYLKDTNIPPPVPKTARNENTADGEECFETKHDQKPVVLVPVTFRCPEELADKLKAISQEKWQTSFDAIITQILEKGLRDG